jgi:GrpB-like predicted nucleotidyltransferase (UPF0157 family)
MIVIINGPCGIGKSVVSEALTRRFDRAVMLDGDYIGAVHPFEIYDDERIDYLYHTLQHLVAFHIREGGYQNFVIPYVFESPDSLADLRGRLSNYDDEIYAFRLIASEGAIQERIVGREGVMGEEVTWYLNRYRELIVIQNVAARYGDLGYEIDTTSLSAEGVADVIWENLHESIILVPYDAAWEKLYESEKALIIEVLGDNILEIQHIGSTAVPGLLAKPIIDILVVVRTLSNADKLIHPLRSIGYSYLHYPQNTDRWFFRKGEPRSHHIHIVEQGSATLADHIDFRNALRHDESARKTYAQLKLDSASRYAKERARYAESKRAFIMHTLKAWRQRCASS